MRTILFLALGSLSLLGMTLDEVSDYALKHSTLLKQQEAQIELSKLNAQASKAGRFGELNVIGDATHYNIERTLAPLTPNSIGAGVPITTSDDVFSAGLSYQLPLFTGFAQTRDIEIASLAKEMAEAKMHLTREQLLFNVRSLYLSLLTQKALLNAQQSHTQALEKLHKQIAYSVKLGKKAKIDTLKSQSDIEASKTKEALFNSNILITKATLSSLVNKEIDVVEDIAITPQEPAYDTQALYHDSLTLSKVAVEDLALLKADKMIGKSKAANLPQLNLSSYVGKNYGQDIKSDDWDDETLWQVGVNLKYNLLDFGKRDAGVQKAKIAKLQAALKKEQLLLDVKKSLIEGVGKIKQAYAQYKGNEAQYALSLQSEKIEQVRYDNDATTLNDLLLAKSKTQFAQAKVIESKYAYQKSVYYVDYLMEKGAK